MEALFSSFIDYIQQIVPLTDEEVSLLLSKVKLRNYLKNQYIVQKGDVCFTTNFIISGCTKTFYRDIEGNEHVFLFSEENWWTSDLGSFVSQTPADFDVCCLEDTNVVQINYHDLQDLYASIPKLESLFRIIVERAYIATQKRLIQNFSLPAKERYLIFASNYPSIVNRVPQYLIASYLGITKQFLSKVKKELVQE